MAVLINAQLKLNEIDQSKVFKGKKHNFLDVTIRLNDETKFGNNVTIYSSQSLDERNAKAPRNYIGNGKVVWFDDNGVTLAEKEEQPQESNTEDIDLPF